MIGALKVLFTIGVSIASIFFLFMGLHFVTDDEENTLWGYLLLFLVLVLVAGVIIFVWVGSNKF